MPSSPFYEPRSSPLERGHLELNKPGVEGVRSGTDIAIPRSELEDWYYTLDRLRDTTDDDDIVELRDRIYRFLP